MLKLLKALALFVALCSAAAAQESTPSESSIRQLLAVTNAQKLVEGAMGPLDAIVQNSMRQALAGRPITPQVQAMLDEMRGRMVVIFREEMDWRVLEPLYIDIYRKSFTQGEIDGMLAFYDTAAGKAVINKMPTVLQHTIQMVQLRMQPIMQKMQALQQETLARLKAQGAK
jgi:hypothetical protein